MTPPRCAAALVCVSVFATPALAGDRIPFATCLKAVETCSDLATANACSDQLSKDNLEGAAKIAAMVAGVSVLFDIYELIKALSEKEGLDTATAGVKVVTDESSSVNDGRSACVKNALALVKESASLIKTLKDLIEKKDFGAAAATLNDIQKVIFAFTAALSKCSGAADDPALKQLNAAKEVFDKILTGIEVSWSIAQGSYFLSKNVACAWGEVKALPTTQQKVSAVNEGLGPLITAANPVVGVTLQVTDTLLTNDANAQATAVAATRWNAGDGRTFARAEACSVTSVLYSRSENGRDRFCTKQGGNFIGFNGTAQNFCHSKCQSTTAGANTCVQGCYDEFHAFCVGSWSCE